jgi:hypothetical protein
MGTIRTYRYELFDPPSREFVRQPGYATEQAIALLRGVAMHSTSKEVPEREVDAFGMWFVPVLDHAG